MQILLLVSVDENCLWLKNVIIVLTFVGNDMLKGISGGQMRRVTLGEVLVCPEPVKVLDAISTGLDASTTYDINNTLKIISTYLGFTIVTSLLQVYIDDTQELVAVIGCVYVYVCLSIAFS